MKILSITFLLTLLFGASWAQSPNRISYQSVVRNSSNALVTNQSVGTQISILQGSTSGTPVYVETHAVSTNVNGLLSLQIGGGVLVSGDMSTIDWSAGPYFIKSEIDPTGGTSYTITGTSQLLSVPYALHAESVSNADDADADPLNEIQSLSISSNDISISSGNTITINTDDADADPLNEIQSLSLSGNDISISGGNTITLPGGGGTLDQAYDFGGAGMGRTIDADAGEVSISTAGTNSAGLRVENSNTGVSIITNNTNAGNTFSPIQSSTNSTSTIAAAVTGNSTGAAWGVAGQVDAAATSESAVYGSNLRTNGGHGVLGIGFNGVVGQTGQSTGNAVYGENLDNIAPLGNGVGVGGRGYLGVVGEDRYAGAVAGAYGVFSNGDLGATGVKTFSIDHPSDPENKVLKHFSLESNEVLNVYRGTATFDANGNATIQLPEYFSDINRNVSYQLTPVGAYMPLFVKTKVDNNQSFVVSGGIEGKEVSWAVYAERNDLYLQKHPEKRDVEVEKREGQKGSYFMPHLYDQDDSKKLLNAPEKVEQSKMSEAK